MLKGESTGTLPLVSRVAKKQVHKNSVNKAKLWGINTPKMVISNFSPTPDTTDCHQNQASQHDLDNRTTTWAAVVLRPKRDFTALVRQIFIKSINIDGKAKLIEHASLPYAPRDSKGCSRLAIHAISHTSSQLCVQLCYKFTI